MRRGNCVRLLSLAGSLAAKVIRVRRFVASKSKPQTEPPEGVVAGGIGENAAAIQKEPGMGVDAEFEAKADMPGPLRGMFPLASKSRKAVRREAGVRNWVAVNAAEVQRIRRRKGIRISIDSR